MSFRVRIMCGGYRDNFILSKGIEMPNGDIEPGPEQHFETFEEACEAGARSHCVEIMGWAWSVEEVPNAAA